MSSLVSVIVPVYNIEPWLRECLDMIAGQTYRNLQVIVVDDGSTDASGAICDEYAAKFPAMFRAIHQKNGGLSNARNRGLREATGEYICFADGDDYVAPILIEDAVRVCAKYQADMVCFGVADVYPKRSVIGCIPLRESVLERKDALKKLFEGKECGISVCDKLYRREIFQNIRFPEGQTNEDAAVIFRLFGEARKIAFLPECLYYYRHRENSITTSAFSEKNLAVVKNALDTLRWTEEKYPDLLPEARGYYAKKLIEILVRLQTLTPPQRKAYQSVERQYKAELRDFRACLPDYKQRIKYFLIMINAYGVFLKAYNRLFRS